jgi:hypothetical protein
MGMGAVLIGLLMGISDARFVRHELMYLGAGIIVFYAGHVLRGGARNR